MVNLASHDQRDPDLSRNHKVLDELTDLVERVSTEVSTERAAFTPKFAGCRESAESELNKAAHFPSREESVFNAPSLITEQPAIQFTPRVLSPEELKQADDAFHFDLRSDFDETEFEEEAE